MNLLSARLIRTSASVVFFVLLCGFQVRAQEGTAASDAKADSTTADAEESGSADSNPFIVPDGDVEELLAFMKKVQTSQPPADMMTRDGKENWLRFQVTAVLAACEKIESQKPDEETQLMLIMQRMSAYRALGQIDETAVDKLEKLLDGLKQDKRPEVRKAIAGHNLTSKAPEFFRSSGEQQAVLIKDLFSYMDEFGIDQVSFSLASQLGEASERSGDPKVGAQLYGRLAQEMKKMAEPRLAPQIAKFEGSARRLNLPGNVMEISGTTAEGEEFDWASYRGKVVLVDFWASWCGPCRAQIPNMKAQLEKYEDKGFVIVGISLDDTKAQYQAFVDREQLPWVNLMSQNENERGWDNPLVQYYGISGIPTAILVDKEGKVVSMMAIGQQLNNLLDQMLGSSEDDDGAE